MCVTAEWTGSVVVLKASRQGLGDSPEFDQSKYSTAFISFHRGIRAEEHS